MSAEKHAELKQRKQHRAAGAVVRRNTMWAVGGSFIPIPVLDNVAIVAVQLKMLAELSDIYDVPFDRNSGKSAIAALICSLGSGVLGKSLIATGVFGSMAKAVPVVGYGLMVLTLPVFNGATTYALGKIFQQHFSAGGTILSFDPGKTEQHFREKFAEGKEFVTRQKVAA
ncbi:YcjF family protein [Thalassospira mesophila]|uniref:GTPase n=1 Tax=Thalassospira mesophila TaxID=1293891 RepID=A0A1Y2KXA5_9PROT|nr:DUF697 domain-containing protein [Thalassospira mesophila]OSQ36742.1 hypothetical protein TMES_16830 [Thalassospira mesophila]